MIRFKCEKCGHKIIASDKEAGGHTKCPNCFALRIVPDPTHVRVRKKVRLRKRPQSYTSPRAKSEEAKTTSEAQSPEYFDEDATEDSSGFLDIRFSETVLFSMTFIFFLLFAADRDMRQNLHAFVSRLCGGSGWATIMGIVFLFVPFVLGMVLSVFHAFSTKGKSFFEKALMLFFAVTISAGTGIYMGWYMLREPGNLWFIPFAIWNLTYSGLLILKFESIVIVENDCEGPYISGRNATIGQIVFSSVAAIVILLCCEYWLKFHWVISYSICITYTTGLDKAVRSMFGRG